MVSTFINQQQNVRVLPAMLLLRGSLLASQTFAVDGTLWITHAITTEYCVPVRIALLELILKVHGCTYHFPQYFRNIVPYACLFIYIYYIYIYLYKH